MTLSIKQQIHELDWRNPDSIIEFYEKNSLYFNNYNTTTIKETVIEFIDIKINYCQALIDKKKYKKALPVLTHVDILIQKIKDDEIEYTKYSTRAIYYEGILKGYLKNYEESYSIFKRLLKEDPENDHYKEWYLNTKAHFYSKQSLLVSYIGMGIIFIDIIALLAFDFDLPRKMLLIGFLMMFGGRLFPYIRKYWIKIKEKID